MIIISIIIIIIIIIPNFAMKKFRITKFFTTSCYNYVVTEYDW